MQISLTPFESKILLDCIEHQLLGLIYFPTATEKGILRGIKEKMQNEKFNAKLPGWFKERVVMGI